MNIRSVIFIRLWDSENETSNVLLLNGGRFTMARMHGCRYFKYACMIHSSPKSDRIDIILDPDLVRGCMILIYIGRVWIYVVF